MRALHYGDKVIVDIYYGDVLYSPRYNGYVVKIHKCAKEFRWRSLLSSLQLELSQVQEVKKRTSKCAILSF